MSGGGQEAGEFAQGRAIMPDISFQIPTGSNGHFGIADFRARRRGGAQTVRRPKRFAPFHSPWRAAGLWEAAVKIEFVHTFRGGRTPAVEQSAGVVRRVQCMATGCE
jgi:hypothetical protein